MAISRKAHAVGAFGGFSPGIAGGTRLFGSLATSGLPSGKVKERRGTTLWTEEEDAYLLGNWSRKTAREISGHLGRARSAVLGRARRLGLSKSDVENEPYGNHVARERPIPSLAKLAFMGER